MTSINSDANFKEETKFKVAEEFDTYTLLDEDDENENFDMVLLSVPPGWPHNKARLICKACLELMDETINDLEANQLTPTHVVDNDKVNEIVNMQPEYDETIDERLPETVTLLKTPDGGKLYLIGTAHFSVESQNDVATIIRAVQPHVVAVELCRHRVQIMQFNEEALYENAANFDFHTVVDMLREFGLYKGLMHIVLSRKVADIVKQLGMPPGGEFRTAFEEAKKVPNCMIHLADRSIDITFQRTLCQLTWWEIIKLLWMVVRLDARISKEDVERFKGKHLIAEMVTKLKEEFPSIERTFIRERDVYLAYSLQVSTQRAILKPDVTEPLRIVAVVGIGHVTGITELWGNVKTDDIRPIMRVPPQAWSTKILKYTIKASLLGVILYMGYRFIPLPKSSALQTMRSSIVGLLDVSGRN
ncbi:traB domain-containing protein isoform X2 [Ceratina calcarata]|uniref:TraB domain-containing protein isoform X2 n=1 Tax=Ceratina calcarata TaxID=156304 RepID=A0AAJ7JGV4_9HYME|nr:traB domain-containing protein isoform X2 [Ceratina calcarata]